MKKQKFVTLISALIYILALGGCGNTAQETEQPPSESNVSSISEPKQSSGAAGAAEAIECEKITGDTEEATISVKPDPWTLTEPPELVVSTQYYVDQVSAQRYGYEWSVKLEGDQMRSTVACGIHPLDDPGELGYAALYTAFPPGSLPPLEEGQTRSSMLPVFYLDFGEIPPETVTATRWPTAYMGHASEHYDDGEQVTVDSSDGFMLVPMGDGEFVYEIHADWGQVGNADYVFITVPKVRDVP